MDTSFCRNEQHAGPGRARHIPGTGATPHASHSLRNQASGRYSPSRRTAYAVSEASSSAACDVLCCASARRSCFSLHRSHASTCRSVLHAAMAHENMCKHALRLRRFPDMSIPAMRWAGCRNVPASVHNKAQGASDSHGTIWHIIIDARFSHTHKGMCIHSPLQGV